MTKRNVRSAGTAALWRGLPWITHDYLGFGQREQHSAQAEQTCLAAKVGTPWVRQAVLLRVRALAPLLLARSRS
jgi:hypothetical protein